MKTHFSNEEYAKRVALLAEQSLNVFPPAIPFARKNKKKKKSKSNDDDEESDKTHYNKVAVPLDHTDPDSQTTEWKVPRFESGDPEDWIKWRISFDELAKAMPLDTGHKIVAMTKTLLRGEAAAKYSTGYDSVTNPRATEETKHKAGIEAIAKYIFNDDTNAWRRQRNYMRYHLFFTEGGYQHFRERLMEMNRYLKYFIIPNGRNTVSVLEEDELLEIVDRAKPIQYQQALLTSNYDPYSKTLGEYTQYLDKLEASVKIQKALDKDTNKNKNGNNKRKNNNKSNNDGNESKGKGKGNMKKCDTCGKYHKGECWFKEGSSNKRQKLGKEKYNKKSGSPTKQISFSQDQFNYLVSTLQGKNKAKDKKKRVITYESESDNSELEATNALMKKSLAINSNSDEDSDYCAETSYSINTRRSKRQKMSHATTEIIVQMPDRNGNLVPIRGLLDSGTTSTILLKRYVNRINKIYKNPKKTPWTTLGGKFFTQRKALVNFTFPEFSNTKKIEWKVHVDEHTNPDQAQYDMIIGSDLMEKLGIELSYKNKTILWDDVSISMKNRGTLQDRDMVDAIYSVTQDAPVLKLSEERHNEIIKIMYAKTDVDKYVSSLNYLSKIEQNKLAAVLKQYKEMYQGATGTLNIEPVHFDLKPNAKPYHAKPFPIPKAYENLIKDECGRFENAGIWTKDSTSEWAAPTFGVPKKTSDVRLVTDFRQLNKWIIQRPYPLPKIQDLLQKLEKFKYATAVDLRKGYYHIPLDEETSRLCTTIFPWGKYRYNKLPMGVVSAPFVFQEVMNKILGDLDYVLVYINDILILSDHNDTFDDHLNKIDLVFKRMAKLGFRVNLLKTEFFKNEIDYLGYRLTEHGIKPQPKKVEAIQRVLPPKNRKQLLRFLGMINYYRDMWKRRSHILAPLTKLSGKSNKKYQWTEEHTKAFEEAKRMVMGEALLAYPDFSKPFHVFTDASDYQLGGVIMQNNKPLAFYTRKLNKAQMNYTTGEQELLGIVETLRTFENILMGQQIVVHTDHLNLLYAKLASARMIRWRMLLEEFGPEVRHVAGVKNVVADALSRLPMEHRDSDIEMWEEPPKPLEYSNNLVKLKDIESETFPMLPSLIAKYQSSDETLRKRMEKNIEHFSKKKIEDSELIRYKRRIYIPTPLQARVISWYHDYLVHPGETRMEQTLCANYYWPGMREQIQNFVKTCHECQLSKKQRKKYGHLPPKRAETEKWSRVNVDLIGPYTVKTPKKTHTLRAMTMIDPATGWFEIAPIEHPSSDDTQTAFDAYWLARYPRPMQVGYDNGGEFKYLFKELIENYGLKGKPTTAYNPQGNSILERVHQVLGNAFRTFEMEKRELEGPNKWEPFCTAVAYAIRSTYHTTLQATPGQLVFGRDMILPIKHKADWAMIAQRKQDIINKSNRRENSKRVRHEYKPGDKVLLEKPGIIPKMSRPRTGPYTVLKIHTNGTLTIKSGAVTDRVNIRRLTPYFERIDRDHREANDVRCPDP